MLNRLGYWLRETFASLRRNLTLTVAAVLTAAVSLLLLGVALLARQGVGNQLVQWKGGVQFIVFMKADATEDQIQSVRTALAESLKEKGRDQEVRTQLLALYRIR